MLEKFARQCKDVESHYSMNIRRESGWANNSLALIEDILSEGDRQFKLEISTGKVQSDRSSSVIRNRADEFLKLLSLVVDNSPTGLEIDWISLQIGDRSLVEYAIEVYKDFGYHFRLFYLKPYFRIVGEYLSGKIDFMEGWKRISVECEDYTSNKYKFIPLLI